MTRMRIITIIGIGVLLSFGMSMIGCTKTKNVWDSTIDSVTSFGSEVKARFTGGKPSSQPDEDLHALTLSEAQQAERQGDLLRARELYTQYLHNKQQEEEPHRLAKPYHRLAVITARLDEFEQSEYYFHQALDLEAENSEIICDYAALLYDHEKYVDAEILLRNALLTHPDHKRTQYLLGLVTGSQRHYQTSFRHFKKALGEKEACLKMAKLYERHGEPNEASQYRQQASGLRSRHGDGKALLVASSGPPEKNPLRHVNTGKSKALLTATSDDSYWAKTRPQEQATPEEKPKKRVEPESKNYGFATVSPSGKPSEDPFSTELKQEIYEGLSRTVPEVASLPPQKNESQTSSSPFEQDPFEEPFPKTSDEKVSIIPPISKSGRRPSPEPTYYGDHPFEGEEKESILDSTQEKSHESPKRSSITDQKLNQLEMSLLSAVEEPSPSSFPTKAPPEEPNLPWLKEASSSGSAVASSSTSSDSKQPFQDGFPDPTMATASENVKIPSNPFAPKPPRKQESRFPAKITMRSPPDPPLETAPSNVKESPLPPMPAIPFKENAPGTDAEPEAPEKRRSATIPLPNHSSFSPRARKNPIRQSESNRGSWIEPVKRSPLREGDGESASAFLNKGFELPSVEKEGASTSPDAPEETSVAETKLAASEPPSNESPSSEESENRDFRSTSSDPTSSKASPEVEFLSSRSSDACFR